MGGILKWEDFWEKFLMIYGGYIEMGGFLGKIFNDIWGVLRAVRRPATYTEGGYAGGGYRHGGGGRWGQHPWGVGFFLSNIQILFLICKTLTHLYFCYITGVKNNLKIIE